MPRLAANLGWLFAERPFLERFGAAAAAGFGAVELLSPYEHAPAAVRAELARFGLSQLGINTPLGREGESGLAALPGREREWRSSRHCRNPATGCVQRTGRGRCARQRRRQCASGRGTGVARRAAPGECTASQWSAPGECAACERSATGERSAS